MGGIGPISDYDYWKLQNNEDDIDHYEEEIFEDYAEYFRELMDEK